MPQPSAPAVLNPNNTAKIIIIISIINSSNLGTPNSLVMLIFSNIDILSLKHVISIYFHI